MNEKLLINEDWKICGLCRLAVWQTIGVWEGQKELFETQPFNTLGYRHSKLATPANSAPHRPFINDILQFFSPLVTAYMNMSDAIALGVVMSVASCGGSSTDIPIRTRSWTIRSAWANHCYRHNLRSICKCRLGCQRCNYPGSLRSLSWSCA